MTELQEAILNMMQCVHDICVENGITYYMVGGTMLGAVRHQGFIPWDDDMDIAMPRKDFEKFLSLSKEKIPEWMEIKKPIENVVNMGYAKVMNRNTTIVEDFKGIRVGGIFIDVFPLDGIENNYDRAVSRLKTIKTKTFMFRAKQNLSDTSSIGRKMMSFIAKIFSLDTLYCNYLTEVQKRDFYNAEYVANTVGVYSIKELTKRENFGKPQLYRFNAHMFYGVEKPDEFLRGIYGDYMQLPPEEKRVSQHGVVYLNLHQPYIEYKGDRVE